jgi:hypothetical protein
MDKMVKHACQRECVITVVRRKLYGEEKYVQMGTLFAQIAFTVDFLGQHVRHAPYAESP